LFSERKQLPVEILLRHETMVATYRAELDRLIGVLSDVETLPDASERLQAIKAALTQLREKPHTRAQQPFDPNNLPNQNLKADPNNQPKTTKDEFVQAGLFNTPFLKLAALRDFSFNKLVGASDP
jgi:hypothetical protein